MQQSDIFFCQMILIGIEIDLREVTVFFIIFVLVFTLVTIPNAWTVNTSSSFTLRWNKNLLQCVYENLNVGMSVFIQLPAQLPHE